MKKVTVLLIIVFSVSVLFTACKETKKDVKLENHEAEQKGELAHTEYECPMDCEDGKTYEKKGSCPVCKMDLKEKEANQDGEHADGCKCKEKGECTCKDGKCECLAEVAVKEKDCSNCESGSCECKA